MPCENISFKTCENALTVAFSLACSEIKLRNEEIDSKRNIVFTCLRFFTSYFIEVDTFYYFGGAQSKGFATLRNVSKLPFFAKIGHAKWVGCRFYSGIWRSESRISPRYLEITSISWIYSWSFWKKKELLFWLSWGLNRLTYVTRLVRGDSKLRD